MRNPEPTGSASEATRARDSLAALVGCSPAMRAVRATLRAVAASEATVLITGETGTGKGLAARLLHAASPRARGPWVHVDCAALAPSLVESELFGHVRGAFTGAASARAGRLQAAAGGTLFLDEVGELEPRLQAKLLRVLQDRVFEPVGDTSPRRLEARIVAATNRDLRRAVAEGSFRADLYYRLQVVELELPPLRARPEDLPRLADHALRELAARLGRTLPRRTPAFDAALLAHPWPGNVRELRNVLERLLVAGAGPLLDAPALVAATAAQPPIFVRPPTVAPPAPRAAGEDRAADDERARIAAALLATGGNVARAARRLGVPRGTLRHRIARLGLGELIPRD